MGAALALPRCQVLNGLNFDAYENEDVTVHVSSGHSFSGTVVYIDHVPETNEACLLHLNNPKQGIVRILASAVVAIQSAD